MKNDLLKEFRNPGREFRGAPFWAWNGKLDAEELKRQIRTMNRMGLGGFFMHARVGLDTPYLSEEWFDLIRTCVDEAERNGMKAWLYDEDRWPSGAAGGLVTKDPQYRARTLVMTTLEKPGDLDWNDSTIAAFTAKIDGVVASNVKSLKRGERPASIAAGESLLKLEVMLNDTSRWYNGYTYLDTLSHEAVRKFIDVTHKAYLERFGSDFGTRIPGIFSDEPNHGGKLPKGGGWSGDRADSLPWTGKLPEVFLKRYGYDLLPRLLELYFDLEGEPVSQARWHYHDCVTHLFSDAFMRQIGEWCGEHNIQFTGHVLEEDTLSSQANMVGSTLRCYEHMQAPGMDLLTEHWRVFATAKQVSSVARQFGRKWRISETYGCTGWDFPFAGHKALGDWQAACGINLRCQHLAWYTMLGEAKRDYPAAIFYQSPWADSYAKVEDYFGRVQAVMSKGEEVRDLLVIHPVESMWLKIKRGWLEAAETDSYNDTFKRMTEALLAEHLDFDYGDEEMLSRLGKVSGSGGETVLSVFKARYRAVLVPDLLTIRAETLALLEKFRAAGGLVVFSGAVPEFVDAKPSKRAVDFARTCVAAELSRKGLSSALAKTTRRISVADGKGAEIGAVLYLLREDEGAFYLFLCNTGEDFVALGLHPQKQCLVRDRKEAFPKVFVRGFAGCTGIPVELDSETGEAVAANATGSANGWEIRTSLPALGSRLFVVPKTAAGNLKAAPRAELRETGREKLEPAVWDYSLSEANALVLDRPRLKLADGPWSPADEVLKTDRKVRAALGLPHRSGDMVQPWAREKTLKPKTLPIQLSYSFRVDALPSGSLFLAVEKPESFEIGINGHRLFAQDECGWWCDRSLKLLAVDPAFLKPGENELILSCDYREDHPGLEIVYLLGNFGAAVEGTAVAMTAPAPAITIGDWVPQGLAFFGGNLTYRTKVKACAAPGERLFVHVPSYRGVAVRVLVDGKEAGIAAWEPNEVDVTDFLHGGEAELSIEVLGHRRNSHGPFHLNEKWPAWTGPDEFQRKDATWFEGYQLVPCGLMAAPEIVTRKA
jgi:hypothetical protein